MRILSVVIALLLVAAVAGSSAAQPELKTEEQKTLYALGLVLAQNLATFALSPADLEIVKAGLTDGLGNKEKKVDLQTYGPKNRTKGRVDGTPVLSHRPALPPTQPVRRPSAQRGQPPDTADTPPTQRPPAWPPGSRSHGFELAGPGSRARPAPEGLNLYVIHGLRRKGSREELNPTIMDVYMGVLPFSFAMILAIAIVVLFPEIALWLPSTMFEGA